MQPAPKWMNWCLNAPKTLIVLCLIMTVVAVVGAKNLYFRGDYKVFFEKDNPQRVAFEEMHNIFNKSENVSFMIVPESGTIYQPDTFSLLYSLTDEAWQTPLSTRVESLANYQHTYAEDDDLIVTDLIAQPEVSDADTQQVRDIVSATPELTGRLVSDNGDVAIINITVQLPDGDQTQEVIQIASFAREMQAKYEAAYPGHTIYLTGMVIMNDAFAVAAQEDSQTLIPMMFLIIAVMIGLITRSVYAAITTMIVVILSIAVTIGVAGWAGLFLSTATVNVPTMVTTLAVADCIHVLVGVRQRLQQGADKRAAIIDSLKLNKRPVIITSVTTAIGFLMLNFSAVPVLADLGNMTAGGVMLACLLSLTLLPALLMVGPALTRERAASSGETFVRLGDVIVRHYRKILPFSALILLVSSLFSANNELNDIAVRYFDDTSTFRQAVNKHEETMGGMSNIDFVIYTDTPYGVTDPALLQEIDTFTAWLREKPQVHHVLSFTDTMKRLNMNMHGDDPAFYRLPEDRELASQYVLLYEMSLPYGLDLNNQMDLDKSALRIIVMLDNLGSKEFTAFETEAKAKFAELNPDVRVTAASPPLMFAHIGERNMESMVFGTVLALVLISGLIVIALRSWRLGLVSLLTNLIPAGVGFGVWGMISGEINMALSVVLSMTMGIIVDDTVHFLSKYQVARQQQQSVADSVRYAFKTVGMALTTTTVVLAAGFGVLTFSSFLLNAHMGQLTVIIIIAALLIDLLFLPAFLLWLDKDTTTKQGVTT
ncbi:efflux RND transporter permease subunit [Alteromonas sp. CYL-A6]|uniref:efflux RND transporter permease subunit n=1 Tax=Alteromonas nitratireducens TaxID=3390813 RepID=UPI0034B270F7